MFQPEKIDFTKTKTFSARDRHNLVRIDNMAVPGQEKGPLFTSPEFDVLVEKLKKARDEKRTITCFIGAHDGKRLYHSPGQQRRGQHP